MPIQLKEDKKGFYYQWGNHGAKYYFNSLKIEEIAYNKALRQQRAIYSHGYKGK